MFITGAVAAAISLMTAEPHSAPGPTVWLSGEIDKRMRQPPGLREPVIEGVAVVVFDAGSNRRAENIRIQQTSGSRAVDTAALRVVQSLPDLPPNFPAGTHAIVLRWDTEEDGQLRVVADRSVVMARHRLHTSGSGKVETASRGPAPRNR